jgi:hypothetical protein
LGLTLHGLADHGGDLLLQHRVGDRLRAEPQHVVAQRSRLPEHPAERTRMRVCVWTRAWVRMGGVGGWGLLRFSGGAKKQNSVVSVWLELPATMSGNRPDGIPAQIRPGREPTAGLEFPTRGGAASAYLVHSTSASLTALRGKGEGKGNIQTGLGQPPPCAPPKRCCRGGGEGGRSCARPVRSSPPEVYFNCWPVI